MLDRNFNIFVPRIHNVEAKVKGASRQERGSTESKPEYVRASQHPQGVLDRTGIRRDGRHDKHDQDPEYVVRQEGMKRGFLNHLPQGMHPEDQHDSRAAESADRLSEVKHPRKNSFGFFTMTITDARRRATIAC
jgi:hypothetical protein